MNVTRRQLLLGTSSFLVLPTSLLAQPNINDTMHFASDTLAIHSQHGPHKLEVELAESFTQRARGLMERDELANNAGMLFLYSQPQPPNSGFWMYRTRIPLDIAYIDTNSRIVGIDSMSPCDSADPTGCPAYAAGVEYVAALEVNAGFFSAHGIDVGDCVSLPGQAEECRG